MPRGMKSTKEKGFVITWKAVIPVTKATSLDEQINQLTLMKTLTESGALTPDILAKAQPVEFKVSSLKILPQPKTAASEVPSAPAAAPVDAGQDAGAQVDPANPNPAA